MLYDTSKPLQRESFLVRAQALAARGETVSLVARRGRTPSQNSYLHAILSYFASRYGESMEYVKEEYFKRAVNPATFVVSQGKDRFTGKRRLICRSVAELSQEQLSLCIERFRNWASKEGGIYLPTAEEGALLKECQIETEKTKTCL